MQSQIVLDEKCTRCEKCIAACPLLLLAANAGGLPEYRQDKQSQCIACGHCAASCPENAFVAEFPSNLKRQALNAGQAATAEQLEDFLKSRRSIRIFKERQIPKEILMKLLETTAYSPSGKNAQPLQWKIVYEQAKMAEISNLVMRWMKTAVDERLPVARLMKLKDVVDIWENRVDIILRRSPHLIMACAPSKNPFARDAGPIALTYFSLAAHAQGIGTCWAGFFQLALSFSSELKKFVSLKEDESCFGALMAGYPDVEFYSIPGRKVPDVLWL